jgi:hypothetical protein
MVKHPKLKIIGLALISFSVIATFVILASGGVPFPALAFLLAFNAMLIFIGYRLPREGGFLLIVLSTIVLAWTSLMAIVIYEFVIEFRVLMTVLAVSYFVGAIFVRFSAGRKPDINGKRFDETVKQPVKLATTDRVLIAVGLSISGFVLLMFVWRSFFR